MSLRRPIHAGLLAGAVWLASCGGSITIGFGGGFDDPPNVSLAVVPERAPPGAALRLLAAAADDHRVAGVQFFRVEPDGRVLHLGEDPTPPYEGQTLVPADGRSTLRLFARAIDDAGQATDSAEVVVTVLY